MAYKDLLTGLSTRNELEDFMSSHLKMGTQGCFLKSIYMIFGELI